MKKKNNDFIIKGFKVNNPVRQATLSVDNLSGNLPCDSILRFSWLLDDPYWFWDWYIKGQGHSDIEGQNLFTLGYGTYKIREGNL